MSQPAQPEETAPYGSGPAAPAAPVKRVRTHHLREMKERGERFTMLTAYDMYTAATFDEAGIEVLLVGDSASNNVFANETSLPVTVDELIPLVRAVTRSAHRALVSVTEPASLARFGRVRSITSARNGDLLVTTDNGGGGDQVLRVSPR